MSIFPATDIVSDVARAADPDRYKAALQRLDSAAAGRAPRGSMGAFESSTEQRLVKRPIVANSSPSLSRERHVGAGAAEKFEAFILQGLFETLLPKQTRDGVREDFASGVWRALMAEQLGAQVASAGGIGLQRLFSSVGTRPPPSDELS